MADSEPSFTDLEFDLVSVQYHALKARQSYDRYVQDAENAGQQEVADFFREAAAQDEARAHRCHDLLRQLQHSR